MSQFLHVLHTHLLSLIGHVWDDLDQHARQRVPSNVTQPLKGSRTTFHMLQSTAWSIHAMCHAALGKWWSHQILTGFPIHAPIFFKVSVTEAYLSSQSCEIHRLGPNAFILIDGFPYMNCNSIKTLKLLHIFVQCKCGDSTGASNLGPRDW